LILESKDGLSKSSTLNFKYEKVLQFFTNLKIDWKNLKIDWKNLKID